MSDPRRVLVGSVMDRLMRALPGSGTEEGYEAAAAYAEGGETALAEYYAALALDEVSTDDGTLLGLGKIRHPLRRKKKKHRGAPPPPPPAQAAPAQTAAPQEEKVAPPPPQPVSVPPAAVERAVTIVMVPVAQAAAAAPVSPPASAPAPAPQVERDYPQSPSTPAPKSDGGMLVPVLAILALAAGG